MGAVQKSHPATAENDVYMGGLCLLKDDNIKNTEPDNEDIIVESDDHCMIALISIIISILCTGILLSGDVLYEAGSVEVAVWVSIAFTSFFFAYTSVSLTIGIFTSMFFGEVLTMVEYKLTDTWEFAYLALALVLFAGYGLIPSMLGVFLRGVFGKDRKESNYDKQ